jgi:chromate reductase
VPLILGISGSLRKASHNTSLLRAAATVLPPGMELHIYGGLREIPPYDADGTPSRLIRQWLHCAGRSQKPLPS